MKLKTRTDAKVRQPDLLIAPGPLPGGGTHAIRPNSPGEGMGRDIQTANDEVSSANRDKVN